MKQLAKKLLPAALVRRAAITRDRAQLRRVPTLACDPSALATASSLDLKQVFNSASHAREWEAAAAQLDSLPLASSAGGINAGDRRAVFYLICALRPQRVLEIGTHIGASTTHITMALRSLADAGDVSLTTVDILDVNDDVAKPWLRAGAEQSPREMLRQLGCDAFVDFVSDDSVDYLKRCPDTYDLIFLDGSHAAAHVYREIAAAVPLLRPGAWILLHDYFPDLAPLWSDGRLIPGPFLATARYQSEGVRTTALPLGALPWPTKQGSQRTSLALLGKA